MKNTACFVATVSKVGRKWQVSFAGSVLFSHTLKKEVKSYCERNKVHTNEFGYYQT